MWNFEKNCLIYAKKRKEEYSIIVVYNEKTAQKGAVRKGVESTLLNSKGILFEFVGGNPVLLFECLGKIIGIGKTAEI